MRLFFGIELTNCARQAAAESIRKACLFLNGRYVDADNLHMTLCYVGEAPLLRVTEIGQNILLPRTALQLGQADYFGVRKDNAILYLRVDGASPYVPIAQALRDALRDAGLPFDPKPFTPHVTLARKVDLSGVDLTLIDPAPICFSPAFLTLFESTRTGGALRYIPVARWPCANVGDQ